MRRGGTGRERARLERERGAHFPPFFLFGNELCLDATPRGGISTPTDGDPSNKVLHHYFQFPNNQLTAHYMRNHSSSGRCCHRSALQFVYRPSSLPWKERATDGRPRADADAAADGGIEGENSSVASSRRVRWGMPHQSEKGRREAGKRQTTDDIQKAQTPKSARI